MDELNASTCGGFFKEVIIDKMFEGEVTDNAVLISRLITSDKVLSEGFDKLQLLGFFSQTCIT